MRVCGPGYGVVAHQVSYHLPVMLIRLATSLLIFLILQVSLGMGQAAVPHRGGPSQPVRKAERTASISTCQGGWAWPVGDGSGRARPLRDFDNPPQDWLPGHRGIDLQAEEESPIRAPQGGYISFAGKVGGKSVVSLRHGQGLGALTSTFEPATTILPIGTEVKRGETLGLVQGHSDHCDGICIHWGLRRGQREYLNPRSKVFGYRIILKPL